MRTKTRKCSLCKEKIELNNDGSYFIEYKNNNSFCTHTKCYIKYHTTKKQKPKTLEECEEFINSCREAAKHIALKESPRIELTDYILEMYHISYFPKHFYVKLDSIYTGTYKNLNRPVPPEDLLDMWKQKRKYLNKVAEQNRQRGKELLGIDRVNYDLGILLSRYDAYLKWKEEQQIAIAEINDSKKRSVEKIDYMDVVRPIVGKNNINKTIDIASMLDEI